MSEVIRAFIAIELPEGVRTVLSELIEGLRRADVKGARLARPEGIHLTLKFLGDVRQDQVEPVASAISHVGRRHPVFTLKLGSPGAFPRRSSPRALWIGLDGDLEVLQGVQRDIEQATASLGFAGDQREFRPHLTLARLGDRASARDRSKAAKHHFAARVEPEPIAVESLSLMRSRLLPGGAAYERLARGKLGGDIRNE